MTGWDLGVNILAMQLTGGNAGNVGIGTTTPDARLHVAGDTHLEGGQRVKVLVVTAGRGITLDVTHYAVVVNNSGTSLVTVTLPPASDHPGRVYVVKNKNTGPVKIAGTIDGNANGLALAKNESATLLSDGTDWLLV